MVNGLNTLFIKNTAYKEHHSVQAILWDFSAFFLEHFSARSSLRESMNRAEQTRKREDYSKNVSVSHEGGKGQNSNQNQKKKQRKRRNSCPFSYIEMIAYAILSSPQKRATLSGIYSFIQNNYPSFTEHRERWKNTVRHNLSLHECFQRGGMAFDRAGCFWHINPRFVAAFSRGDFSRRKSVHSNNLPLDGWNSLVQDHIAVQRPCLQCYIYKSNPPFSVAAPMEPPQYQYEGLTLSTALSTLPTYPRIIGY